MFEPVIAPSGTLLGLLQRGRGDGTLHALAAPRAQALEALDQCVAGDPRQDWQVENRSLYYARLYLDLDGPLGEIEAHLFGVDDVLDEDDNRTGLALSVLGHLASYGRDDALMLLRRYAATGANWAWALDELALRDDDGGLRSLAAPVLARFPATAEGEARLAAAVRDAYEPRPWRLWEEAAEPNEYAERLRAARQQGSFDRWQRQLTPRGPQPGWGVQAVFDWAADGLRWGTPCTSRPRAAWPPWPGPRTAPRSSRPPPARPGRPPAPPHCTTWSWPSRRTRPYWTSSKPPATSPP